MCSEDILLFSLSCNDLPELIVDDDGDAEIHMYADDNTLYVIAPTYDTIVFTLNRVLAKLYTWCTRNRLTPHPGKTEFMLLTRKQFIRPKQAILLGDHLINEVTSTRSLAVEMDNQLKWDRHLNELIKCSSEAMIFAVMSAIFAIA